MFDGNFNFVNVANRLLLVVVAGIFAVIAVNFEFIISLISAVDGNTTISFNLHTAAILCLFAWIGGIQLHLMNRNKSEQG